MRPRLSLTLIPLPDTNRSQCGLAAQTLDVCAAISFVFMPLNALPDATTRTTVKTVSARVRIRAITKLLTSGPWFGCTVVFIQFALFKKTTAHLVSSFIYFALRKKKYSAV